MMHHRKGKAVFTWPLLSLAMAIRKMLPSLASQKELTSCAFDGGRFGPQTAQCGAFAGHRVGLVAAYTIEFKTCCMEQVSGNMVENFAACGCSV
jgi:hypothetical protein